MKMVCKQLGRNGDAQRKSVNRSESAHRYANDIMEKAKRKRRNIRDGSSEVKRKEEKHGTMREMRQQEEVEMG